MEASKRDELILRAMIHMVIVDGTLGENEVTRIRWIYGRTCGHELGDAQVYEAIAKVAGEADLEAFLKSCADELDTCGRRLLLQAAYAVAMADGKVCDVEDAMLVRFAQTLEVSPSVYRSLMSPFKVTRELVS